MDAKSKHGPQLSSLFLPATDDKLSGKASVVIVGGHWPDQTASSSSSSPQTERGPSGGSSYRLADYAAQTSLLAASPPASHIATILRSGGVEVFNMTDGARGPWVQHTIPAPDKATAHRIGLVAANSVHSEGFTKSRVSCATLIPAEIALRQRLEEVGHITPGPVPITGHVVAGGHSMGEAGAGSAGSPADGAGSFPAPPAALGIDDSAHFYSPPHSNRHGDFSLNGEGSGGGATLASSAPDAHQHNHPRHPSASLVPPPTAESAAPAPPLFSDSEWRETISSLWRGVVGTTQGEVMVFDGKQYVLAFRCSSYSPVLHVSCVLLPEDDNAIGGGDSKGCDYAGKCKQQQQQHQAKKKGSTHRSAGPEATSASQQRFDMSAFSSTVRANSGLGSSNSNISMAAMGGAYARTNAVNIGSAYFSVGFVTLQRDGSVLCWRRPRLGGVAGNGGAALTVSPNPVVIQGPSVFSKAKAIEVTHRFTVPMTLSNRAPHFPFGIETFIDEQRAVMGVRPSTGAASVPASNTFANNPFWTNELHRLQRPLSAADAFYAWDSPSGAAPEPLPLVSVVLLPESGGLGGTVCARSVYGRRIDEDVQLDGKLKYTTAIQCDSASAVCVFAREKNLFTVDYAIREIRRILGTGSPITHVAYSHPIVVAGCENGNIFVVGAHNGAVLAEYATYNASRVRHLSFHYGAMLVTIVDDSGGEVEVVQLPTQFLRCGLLPQERYETRQTQALKFGIIAAEAGNNAVARRSALDQRLMAQLSVPGCVQQYLSHTHVLK